MNKADDVRLEGGMKDWVIYSLVFPHLFAVTTYESTRGIHLHTADSMMMPLPKQRNVISECVQSIPW